MWLCLLSISALAGSVDLPIPLGIWDSPSIAMGPDGTLHVVGRRTASAKRFLSSIVSSASDPASEPSNMVYLRQDPDGAWSEEAIPPPSQLDGWGGSEFHDATVTVDEKGRPILVYLEDFPKPEGTGSDTFIYVSEREADGWTTTQIPTWIGTYGEVSLGVYDGRWTLAAHYVGSGTAEKVWTGIVRFEEGAGDEVKWHKGDPLIGELALVEGAKEPELLYRRLGVVYHLDAEGSRTKITDGSSKSLSAVRSRDGLRYLMYRANKDRPYIGLLGSAPTSLDTKEAGWHSDLALDPSGRALATWYYRRNAFNKGLVVARQAEDGGFRQFTVVREENENIGWNPTLAVAENGNVAISMLNRSKDRLVVRRYDSVDALEAEALPDTGDWTENRQSINAVAYGGAWFTFWEARTSAPDPEDNLFEEGVEALGGSLDVDPGLSLEGGFAGRVGRFDLALEYMRRNSGSEGVQALNRVQNLAGKLSMDKIPLPGSQAQLHFRAADLSGQWTDDLGTVKSFEISERMIQLRYVGKSNGYFGASYRTYGAPQDVYTVLPGVDDAPDTVLGAVETEADFAITSVIGGWSVMNYLGRYEISHVGPYVDGQMGLGSAAGEFTDPTGATFNASALAMSVQLDVGIVAYKRVKRLHGAGLFAQGGLRGDGQMMARMATGEDVTYTYARVDGRYGPYANVGVVY